MNSRDLLLAVVAAGVLALAGSLGTLVVPETVEATTPSFWKDYNDDGKPDLAIGIPGERVGGFANAGAVQVIYGRNPDGFSSLGQQFFNENNIDATDGPSQGDRFGAALASGDFDDDGFSDLAIGIPGEDLGANPLGVDRGAITILWGSEDGLVEDDAVNIETGPNHNFGSSLVALDMFDQSSSLGTAWDGIADLVVGDDQGVTFFLGATRNFLNVPPTPRRIGLRGEDNLTSFRIVLCAGNLDSDRPHELIVGMPDKAVGNVAGAGQIAVIDRITPPSSGFPFDIDFVTQDDYNFTSVAGDNFGAAVAIGNLVGPDEDADSIEEVLVGAPGRNVAFKGSSRNDAGAVYMFALGFAVALTQKSEGVPDNPEAGDRFGASLLIGGFSTTGGLGIAMGAPGEQIGSVDGAGAVIISELGEGGTGTHRYLISQNTINVPGTVQAGDNFGASLASGDYDGVGAGDLAIGAPNDNPSGVNNAGSVYVIYHDQTQLTPQVSDILWSQATSGIPTSPQSNDKFGAVLR